MDDGIVILDTSLGKILAVVEIDGKFEHVLYRYGKRRDLW